MSVLIGIAAGMTFAAFVTTFLAWVSVEKKIMILSSRVKDYLVITPGPGVQGAVSARLFEAMKDVCTAAMAKAKAEKDHTAVHSNKTALMSDVDLLWKAKRKTEEDLDAAVERYKKIEGAP